MKRKRLLVLSVIVALVAVSLLFASAASAKEGRRGQPIQWDPPTIREKVLPAQVYNYTVTLSSTKELGLVRLWVTPSLRGILTFAPTEEFTLSPGITYTVTITLTVPSEDELDGRGSLNGLLKVRKVWPERMHRAYPHHLRLRFPIVRETD